MKSYQISGDFMNGVVNIFKPRGITSHDVVKKMRKVLGIKKNWSYWNLRPQCFWGTSLVYW
ncbi:hypothetical protein TXYLGN1_22420 [Tepidimicrobium xylanilyticum]